jgi:hypothetical protein
LGAWREERETHVDNGAIQRSAGVIRWGSGRGGGDQTGEARSGSDRKGTALTEHRGGIRGGDATPTRAYCDAACRRCNEGGAQRWWLVLP